MEGRHPPTHQCQAVLRTRDDHGIAGSSIERNPGGPFGTVLVCGLDTRRPCHFLGVWCQDGDVAVGFERSSLGIRDDRPAGSADPPAVFFRYSPDRKGERPRAHLANFSGVLQADAYAGFTKLYTPDRKDGPITEAACWAHARRKFFDLARLAQAPIAAEAVKRIDLLFAIEREINGLSPQERARVRQERSRPLTTELQIWFYQQRAKLSKNNDTTKAINYILTRWDAFTRFLDDGRICLSNNAAERELRTVAVGRKNWTFAGSDEGGRRAAAIYTLIATAKLNTIDPQAWLADVLARLPDHSSKRIHELLPWNWRRASNPAQAA